LIRRIAIGSDYKTAMHYIVGQSVLNDTYKIHLIKQNVISVEIWIQSIETSEIVIWKSYNIAMPISIEYNINY